MYRIFLLFTPIESWQIGKNGQVTAWTTSLNQSRNGRISSSAFPVLNRKNLRGNVGWQNIHKTYVILSNNTTSFCKIKHWLVTTKLDWNEVRHRRQLRKLIRWFLRSFSFFGKILPYFAAIFQKNSQLRLNAVIFLFKYIQNTVQVIKLFVQQGVFFLWKIF